MKMIDNCGAGAVESGERQEPSSEGFRCPISVMKNTVECCVACCVAAVIRLNWRKLYSCSKVFS